MMPYVREDLRQATGGRTGLYAFVRTCLIDMGFRAVVYHRLAHWLHRHHVKYLPALVAARCVRVTGSDILPQATIGPGFVVKHPAGVVVGYRARIGERCTLMQNVTLGEKYSKDGSHAYPTLGDDVTVCAGAVVLGGIRIGDGATIGANSVVIHDVPAGAVVVGAPARPLPVAPQRGS